MFQFQICYYSCLNVTFKKGKFQGTNLVLTYKIILVTAIDIY